MSEATEVLARSRLAIVQHVQRRGRRPERERERDEPPLAGWDDDDDEPAREEPPVTGTGWLAQMKRAFRTWWRYHPAHMATDLMTPALQDYAQRKPVQLLGIAAAAGAALTFARPWKLISFTTLAIAVNKSSQLTGILAAAMSAADFRMDHDHPQ